MSDEGFGVDRATQQAWRAFQAELADQLASLQRDDPLLLEALTGQEPDEGTTPYVQFCAWGDGMLRGEVSSDHVLGGPWRTGAAGADALGLLGYDAPTYGPGEDGDDGSLNYYADLPQAEADRLAVMAVRALRDVFGVVHPALLCDDALGQTPVVVEPAAFDRVDEDTATYPHGGHEELVELVDRALTPYFGHVPRHDDDGDIPVDVGRTMLFVRVQESVPVVEMFCCLATDVTDREQAMFEINVLNRDVRFVKFRLVDDSILADLQLPAWPFAPEHLCAMLALMSETVERVEADLIVRVGGRALYGDPDVEVADHPGGDDDDDHPEADSEGTAEAEILAQLEAECAGSVSPELAASICGYDTTRLLGLIRQQETERREWRTVRDEIAEGGQCDVGCDHEIAYAERMVRLLRQALRVVVEREAAREESLSRAAESSETRGERRRQRRRPPRPRQVPDPTIEEVDPEIWS